MLDNMTSGSGTKGSSTSFLGSVATRDIVDALSADDQAWNECGNEEGEKSDKTRSKDCDGKNDGEEGTVANANEDDHSNVNEESAKEELEIQLDDKEMLEDYVDSLDGDQEEEELAQIQLSPAEQDVISEQLSSAFGNE